MTTNSCRVIALEGKRYQPKISDMDHTRRVFMTAVCFAAVALLGFITPVAAQDAGVWMGDRRAAWLKEAAASMPELRRTEHHPVRIVRSVADSTAFQGWRMEPSEPIEALYASSLKQRRKVIVDMGEHMTGYFSLREPYGHAGRCPDTPAHYLCRGAGRIEYAVRSLSGRVEPRMAAG